MSEKRNGLTVAIDGPAGAGKSTVAKRVALQLNYTFVDTGAVYRSLALGARQEGIAWDDEEALAELSSRLPISFKWQDGTNHVFLGTQDVSEAIREHDISDGASRVSSLPKVRAGLLQMQRTLAGGAGAVLECRDIGTVVCPDAKAKFFLDANVKERARRRYKESVKKGEDVILENIEREIEARDKRDRERESAPLKAADDAVIIDSTSMSIDEVVTTIISRVRALAG
ncbi:(d)CMP kinase [Myxococcota bacterium]|nr:(d)CMP kinase [Myxococcota bacterium]